MGITRFKPWGVFLRSLAVATMLLLMATGQAFAGGHTYTAPTAPVTLPLPTDLSNLTTVAAALNAIGAFTLLGVAMAIGFIGMAIGWFVRRRRA